MTEPACGRHVPHGPHGFMAPIDSQFDSPPAPIFSECGGFAAVEAVAEAVDHPMHYGGADNPYEAIKVIRAWGLGFNLGNAVKYISRAGKKDPDKLLEDLRKALWYLNDEIATLEASQ